MKKCKTLLTLALILFGIEVSAKVSPVLICLGEEEAVFHKNKDQSPLFWLNQEIISFFGSFPSSYLNQSSFKKTCPQTASFFLLKQIILRPEMQLKQPQSIKVSPLTKDRIQSTRNNLLKILISFINKTQVKETQVDCISSKSESYKKLSQNIFYFEENIPDLDVLAPKKLLYDLFDDLSAMSITGDCSLPKGL